MRPGDGRFQVFCRDIVDEILADAKRAAAKLDLGHALFLDPWQGVGKVVRHVTGIERCADGDDGLDAWQFARRAQHGRAAKRVTDQKTGRHIARREIAASGDEVVDIRGERGVLELSTRMAKPGEIEAQHRDAHRGKARGDAARGGDILGAGEAMREKGGAQMRAVGHVEPGGKLAAVMAGESDAFGWHCTLLLLTWASLVGRVCARKAWRICVTPW